MEEVYVRVAMVSQYSFRLYFSVAWPHSLCDLSFLHRECEVLPGAIPMEVL